MIIFICITTTHCIRANIDVTFPIHNGSSPWWDRIMYLSTKHRVVKCILMTLVS
jgi:hypothetical protein